MDDGAGDVGGLVGGEPQAGFGDLAWLSETVEEAELWRVVLFGEAELFECAAQHRGVDRAGGDGVDADVESPVLECGDFGESVDAVFGGDVGGGVGWGRNPLTEEMLMIDPPPPWRIICCSSHFMHSAVPLRSTDMSRSQ